MKEGYKKTELGWIPEEWEILKVDKITENHKQGYYSKNKYVDKGTYIVRITDLRNPKICYSDMPKLEVDAEIINQYKLSDGDFLFARSGAIGRYGIFSEKYPQTIFASYIIKFRFNNKKVINKYVGYFYESEYSQQQLKAITQGSSNININANNIKSLLMCIPTLKEQEKIADILSTVDSQIDYTDELIEKTKELKKGLMQTLLTKGIGHSEFKKSEVGEIPVEWEVKKLVEITDVRDGTHDSPKYLDSGIPFITSKNLVKGKIDFNEVNYISLTDHEKFSQRSRVDDGDILFGMIGTIGSPVIVKKSFDFSIKNVALIKINSQNVDNIFLLYLLQSNFIKKQFERLSKGGVQKFIALGTIRNLLIMLPSISEQKQIADILSSVDVQIDEYENKKAKLEELKKGLMQKLLTGEIRVKY